MLILQYLRWSPGSPLAVWRRWPIIKKPISRVVDGTRGGETSGLRGACDVDPNSLDRTGGGGRAARRLESPGAGQGKVRARGANGTEGRCQGTEVHPPGP